MDCKTARSMLEAYLDNELDRADARELEAHVDGCEECRAELTRLDALRRALREPSLRFSAPATLRARIATPAETESGTVPSARSGPVAASRRARLGPSTWQRLAAACVLAFGAGAGSVYLWNS